MKITWFGTASIAVEGENGRILFDPFLPLDKSDVHTDESSFRGYESILITHGHVDHISSIPCIFSGQNIYCTKTPLSTLKKDGIPEECLHLVKPGDTFITGIVFAAAGLVLVLAGFRRKKHECSV